MTYLTLNRKILAISLAGSTSLVAACNPLGGSAPRTDAASISNPPVFTDSGADPGASDPVPTPKPSIAPKPSATPSATPTITSTPMPSATPTPSASPKPSATPSATPSGKTYQVGPGRTYTTLQQVVNLVAPGDTVVLDGGVTYAGGARFTRDGTANAPITIRGTRIGGKRPVLSGGNNAIEAAGDYNIFEGLDITGGTSRCFYQHGDHVTLRDSVVHDCPAQGILGSDFDSGHFTMEYVEVYASGNGTQHHPIYMASDEKAFPQAVFRMQHCYVHDNKGGNAVKSRARRNEIYYNWIDASLYRALELIGVDSDSAQYSQDLMREDSDVVGNVIRQPKAFYSIRVGGDLLANSSNGRYRFVNNTILVTGGSAVFQLYQGLDSIEMHDNLIHRTDAGAVNVLDMSDAVWASNAVSIGGTRNWIKTGSTAPTGWTDTLSGATPGFVDPAALDLRLMGASPLVNAGNQAAIKSPAGHEFVLPLEAAAMLPPLHAIQALGAALPRVPKGALDIGAFE